MPFESVLTSADSCALFDASAMVQRMLDVEAAMAWARVDCGLLDAKQAGHIAQACQVEHFDVAGLVRDARRSGSLIVPLVEQLVLYVAQRDPQAASQVHICSTSQDVIDTAVVLATKDALALIERDLNVLIDALLKLARDHVSAPILARTLMQPAAVQPFGLKALNWVRPLWRCRVALRTCVRRALVLQLGGPAGCLGYAHPAERAFVLAAGRRLNLDAPDGAWHTQRDEWARLACELAVLCGAGGKLACDWALMSQSEIAELLWDGAPGAGASSAMPHKRNPVAALMGIAAASRAPLRASGVLQSMVQEHERALGAWHVELAEWVGLLQSTAGSMSALSAAATSIRIDVAQMRRHIDAQQGLVFSQAATELLSPIMGRRSAKEMVAAACEDSRRTGRHLQTALGDQLENANTWPPEVKQALDGVFNIDSLMASMVRQVAPCIDAMALEQGSSFPVEVTV
jgi:3-carboxy-cis,cis-muconate cycloisomerase